MAFAIRRNMAKKKITEIVQELIGDFLQENSYELYHTEFVKEGRDWFLRVYIDLGPEKEQEKSEEDVPRYVSTEDCEKVSRFLSTKLDEEDPIEQNYYLEVSSPGMDRPLITPNHYEKYIGQAVEIKLYKAIDNKKEIQGILNSFVKNEGSYDISLIDDDDKKWNFQLSDVAKARLAVIF